MTRRLALAFVCAALLGSSAGAQSFPSQPAPQRVVLLYDERTDLPGLSVLDAALTRVLDSGPRRPEVYREAMDLSRFDSEAYRVQLRDYLRAKYAGREIAAAVAVMGPSLDFLLAHGSLIFPGARIVFCGIDRRELGERALPPQVTGVVLKREFAPTLELALRLQPETRNVVVVSGTSTFDARLLQQARAELAPYEDRLSFRYLSQLPMRQLLGELARLPPRTVVLYTTLFKDGAGQSFVPHEVVARVSQVASAPVYGFVDQFLGRGIVGGHLYSVGAHGDAAGRLVLKILAGDAPSALPLVEASGSRVQLDARQLARWGIDDALIPPGATVLYQPRSLWREYQRQVLVALAIVSLQSLMISGLLLQRARRRRAEARLRESETRFRTIADTASVMLWIVDVNGLNIFCNQAVFDFAGTPLDEQLGLGWAAMIHPDDRHRTLDVYQRSLERRERFTFESRFRRHDGEYRWLLCTGVPRYAEGGAFEGYVGSCVDITLRHEAELEHRRHAAEVAHLNRLATSGVLTAAIAHELSQPLTAILYNAKAASIMLERVPPPLEKLGPILAEIRRDDQRAADIIRRLRELLQRHELARRPLAVNQMVLETVHLLNVEAAARHVALTFEPSDADPVVAGDRVHLQQVVLNLVLNAMEAVSSAPLERRRVAVRTCLGDDGTVRITVRDSGPGVPPEALRTIFEPFNTTKANGLGLGLSISRTIVEAHEGRIWAENTVRGGASFNVMIPLLGPGAGPPAADSPIVRVAIPRGTKSPAG